MSDRQLSRRDWLRITGTTGALGLAGCTGGDNQKAQDNTDQPEADDKDGSQNNVEKQNKSMTLWAWNDPGLSPVRKKQAKAFKEKTGIGANWQYYPFEDYIAKAVSAIPAGNAPDSLALSVLWVPRFGNQNVAVDLKQEGFKPDDYIAAARNNSMYKDGLYAVPWYADCRMLAINRKMFKEAGLEVPDPTHRPSWEEFASWVDALAKEHGTGYSMASGEGFDSFVLSNGGSYLNDDGTKAAINNDAALEAANYLWPKVVEEKSITSPNGTDGSIQELLSKSSPMAYAGSWQYPRLRDSGLDWQYNPHPGGPQIDKSHTWSAGVYYSVPSRGGANKKFGLKWLEYINSMEVQTNVAKAVGGFPGRKEAYETDAFKQFLENNQKIKPVAQEMKNAVAFPSHPKVGKMWTVVHQTAESMWQGKKPKPALDAAAKEINNLL